MSKTEEQMSKVNNSFDSWIVQDYFDKIEIHTDGRIKPWEV